MTNKHFDQQALREYYGKILQKSEDLKTSACCSADPMEPRVKAVLQQIEDEIKDKFYGCGSPIPHRSVCRRNNWT